MKKAMTQRVHDAARPPTCGVVLRAVVENVTLEYELRQLDSRVTVSRLLSQDSGVS